MPSVESEIKGFVKELGSRAFHTAWETALATGAILWGGSGLHVSDLLTVSGLDKAWTIVGAGTVAAMVAAVRFTAVSYFKSNVPLEQKIVKEIAAQELSHIPPVVKAAVEAQSTAQAVTAAHAAAVVQSAVAPLIEEVVAPAAPASPSDPFKDA